MGNTQPQRMNTTAPSSTPRTGLTTRDSNQASRYYHDVMREAVKVVRASDAQRQTRSKTR